MWRATLVALLVLAAAAPAAGAASIAGCPLFPRSFSTNQRVDSLPVAPDSDAIVGSIGAGERFHPDFGTRYGIPYNVVDRRTARRRLSFEYAGESDRGPYPIPARPRVEGGSDRHVLLLERDHCRLYEIFAYAGTSAGSGAIWSLRSTRLRPAGWTSADAAGLPILPLLARYQEVRRGRIDHALRMTVRRSRRAYVYPARHFASSDSDPSLPRMGERLRLKRSVDLSGFPPQARVVARAMKRYGVIVADNGSDWFVTGAPHPRWDDEQLNALKQLRGSDFEVVRVPHQRPRAPRAPGRSRSR